MWVWVEHVWGVGGACVVGEHVWGVEHIMGGWRI